MFSPIIKGWEGIKYLAVHHTGGTLSEHWQSTQHHLWEDVNEWHRERWPEFKSELGFWGGYNFFIDQFGFVMQFRKVGEETAANLGHNKDTISVCLAGNFTKHLDGTPVDTPTEAQVAALKEILLWAYSSENYGAGRIKWENIVPHRGICQTECYGDALADDWARNLVKDDRQAQRAELSALERILQDVIVRIADLRRKMGGARFAGFHGRG